MLAALQLAIVVLFLALLVGMIKPAWVIRWGNKQSRLRVLLYYGVPFLVVLTLAGNILADKVANDFEAANRKWAQGDTVAAGELYQRLAESPSLPKSQRVIAIARAVEALTQKGNEPAAIRLLELAFENGMNPEPTSTKGRRLKAKVFARLKAEKARALAQQEAERRRKEEEQLKRDAYVMAEHFVEQKLKAPKTADFPPLSRVKIYRIKGKPNMFGVRGYVDAKNSFGAEVRTQYLCELEYLGGKDKRWRLVNLVFVR